jgi:hypothetical protein
MEAPGVPARGEMYERRADSRGSHPKPARKKQDKFRVGHEAAAVCTAALIGGVNRRSVIRLPLEPAFANAQTCFREIGRLCTVIDVQWAHQFRLRTVQSATPDTDWTEGFEPAPRRVKHDANRRRPTGRPLPQCR